MCYQDCHKACLERNKQTIFELMSRFGIHKATLEYRGFDGDGGVNHIAYHSPKAKRMARKVILPYLCVEYHTEGLLKVGLSVITRQMSLHDALAYFALDLLEQEQPHWSVNAGSEGTLILDSKQRQCALKHTAYFTESLTRQVNY